MLQVIKRSGDYQPFNIEKIKNVIAQASDRIRQPMGKAEINLVANAVYEKLSSQESVTSREIYDAVVAQLRAGGYSAVADSYISGAGNFWNNNK